MTNEEIWNNDTPIMDLCTDIEVPDWIEQDISPYDVASIQQGGCASGAYMPAVTYYQALNTMEDHGDDILDYIENVLGEIPQPEKGTTWSGLAVFYVSIAVELWAFGAYDQLEELEAA